MWNKARLQAWGIRLAQLLVLTGFLTAWEIRARQNPTFQFFLSRPLRIGMRVWDWTLGGNIHRAAAETLGETLIGFAIGTAGGLVLALVCYYSPLVFKLLEPMMNIANAMPRVVFGPLFILWFGLGMTSKVVLAASLVLFIVFFATLAGLQEVEQKMVDKVRLMGASRWELLRHVLLPSALTWVFSSLRSGVGFALAGAVVGEYVGAGHGLGYMISLSEGNLDSTGVFAGLLVLAAMVLVMNAILAWVERKLTPWRIAA